MNINPTLTKPQSEFAVSTEKWPAFVGGYGAGKSEALITRVLLLLLINPKGPVGYFAPTFDLIRLIAWPRFLAKCDEWGLKATLNKSENTLTLKRGGRVIFRTMEDPKRIVGYELADAAIDELDTLKEDHAEEAWRAINSRCRLKKPNGEPNTVAVATTPEGFKLVYRLWEEDPKPGFKLYRAPTSSNPFVPPGYVEQLRAQYPPHLLKAYLEGLFTNLVSGSVYPDFDRKLNHTDDVIIGNEPLHVGMDFNVNNMTAIVCVMRQGEPSAVREFTKIRDTPAMCAALRKAFPDNPIYVYPDASGQNGSSKDAADSDLQILKNARFQLFLKPGIKSGYYNPKVKDRVAAVNRMILDGNGFRRFRINTRACPTLAQCLEQQVYAKDGTPDKSQGKDHGNDALGYFLSYVYPVTKPIATHGTQIIHTGR